MKIYFEAFSRCDRCVLNAKRLESLAERSTKDGYSYLFHSVMCVLINSRNIRNKRVSMTVVYAHKVQKVAGRGIFGNLWKILFLWKGSVYKLVYADLAVWLTLYSAISITRRFLLDEEQQIIFDKLCAYCSKFSEFIPLSFVLGFYVSLVVSRWWIMWDMLPWPDDVAMFVTAVIRGQDERARLMRRTIMRYVNLAGVHTMALFSSSVRRRFPTLDHLVSAGLLEEGEKQIFEEMSGRITKLYWLPLVWATTIAVKARREKIIEADVTMKTILDHITEYRRKCEKSLHIEVINVPLVYSQVVTLAVYTFFGTCLFGRQFVNEMASMDSYVPIFTLLQFLFYMGWLKVAETLLNPYGEDDDDFELNWLIDRHLEVSYMIVDEMHATHPELVKDVYWDEVLPTALPAGDTVPTNKVAPPPFAGSFCDLTSARKTEYSVPQTPACTPEIGHFLANGGQSHFLQEFSAPTFILKKPPVYKRFLSSTVQRYTHDDPEKGSSHNSLLDKKYPLSTSMQDCKTSPVPKRSTTVSDKMYRYFQDRTSTSSGSRQYLSPIDAATPLTTVIEDENDHTDAHQPPQQAASDDTSSTVTADAGIGDHVASLHPLFSLATVRYDSQGSNLSDATSRTGSGVFPAGAGSSKERNRTTSTGLDSFDGDQSPGIFLMVPSLPKLQERDRDTQSDKGA